MDGPQTLRDVILHFADEQIAFEYIRDLRWPGEPACPQCSSGRHSFLSTRKTWKCKACGHQFSVRSGTIFEGSPLPLGKWITAVWLLVNSKNGVSSHELGRSIGVTQKTAWHMLQRIRLAMQNGTIEKLAGTVEVDETYVGGKFKFMHYARKKKFQGRGTVGKAIVMGFRQRGGIVRCKVIPNITKGTLCRLVRENVEPGATVYSDALSSYDHVDPAYEHRTVDHSRRQYTDGTVSTNGIENFWCLLKRAIKGTYAWVSHKHLHRYVEEATFRYNHRKMNDLERFVTLLGQAAGRQLTYRELIT